MANDAGQPVTTERIREADLLVTGGFAEPPDGAPLEPSQPIQERTRKRWAQLAEKNEIHLSPLRFLSPEAREIAILILTDLADQLKALRVW